MSDRTRLKSRSIAVSAESVLALALTVLLTEINVGDKAVTLFLRKTISLRDPSLRKKGNHAPRASIPRANEVHS